MSTTKRDAANPLNDPRIGQKLGDYTLLRVIGTGGMARIYEGKDERLGRQAAVKVLEPDKLEGDESLMRRFDREARSVAVLEHDNIIHIYQYGEQDGTYFLAMKLIRGHDLAQELKRHRRAGQRIDPARILHVLEQVASALDYAHEHGVIHRDVKPSNILIDTNDKATLTDFGLVLHQSIDATLGTAFGTPRYMSPEQAVASSKAVPQSDTYSLGVILYEALTGETPFTGDTPMEIAMNHVNEAPRAPRALNPGIPPQVEREILRVLDKDPAHRHPTALDFIAAVRAAYDLPTTLPSRVPAAPFAAIETQTAAAVNPSQPSIPAPSTPPSQPSKPSQPTAPSTRTQPTTRLDAPRGASPIIIAAAAVALVVIVIIVIMLLRTGM